MIISYRHLLEGEGAGSMYQREVMTLLAALITKCGFYRTQNKLSSNHYLDENYDSHVAGWNQILSFLDHFSEENPDETDLVFVTFDEVLAIIESAEDRDFSRAIATLRNHVTVNTKNRERLKITLHMRAKSRGDVLLGFDSLPYEYVDQDYGLPRDNPEYYSRLYVSLLNSIAGSSRDVDCFVCTTADPIFTRKFLKDVKKNVTLHLDQRPDYQDFMHMIDCDVLVMAKSSLSYLASFLNTNKKYIRKNYRHRLPPDTNIFFDENYISLSIKEKYWDVIIRPLKSIVFRLNRPIQNYRSRG